MYEEAKATDYQFGMVVANQAIGDAYNTIANMGDKALESYQDALTELSNISGQHPYKAQLLLKMSNVLQRKGRLEEAEKILEELEKILYQEPDYPTDFFFLHRKDEFLPFPMDTSHKTILMKQTSGSTKWTPFTNCTQRSSIGFTWIIPLPPTIEPWEIGTNNTGNKLWTSTPKLQAEYSGNKRSTYYRWTSLEKIYLCKIQGMAMEACRIYQELYPPIDTLASQSYIRQINTIKAKYQVDKAETASNNEYNKIITSILVGTMALVTLFVLLAILLKRQREKVKLSTQKLATSRINAENAMRAKSVFLSNMSHEIRTPLNALSGFSSLLTEEGLDDETRRQCNEVIQQNSELLLKLINDVIDLSSLEFGKLQFCIAQHDAVSICKNVIDTVNKVKQTQAELTFTTELEEMPIETDDSRLQQVLINLLINATKFTPQGSIVLKTGKRNGRHRTIHRNRYRLRHSQRQASQHFPTF